jgi:poly(3-hydroxyalkanoate) depolymerase
MNIQTIRVGQQEIRAAVKPGAKNKPALLLFNGIGANLELAVPFMQAIDDVEVVIFDVPGVGGSPAPILPYRASQVAKWAAELMKQLGHEKYDVAGVSWGGAMAQQFAHQYPEICRKLILAATSPGAIMIPAWPSVLLKMASPRRYTDKRYMRTIAPLIYGGAFRDDINLIHQHAENMKGATRIGYAYQLAAVFGWSSLPWLHKLRFPTLVLMGSDDPLVPMTNGKILARLIPNAKLEIIDDGHLFFVTKPQETARLVERFIAEA